MADKQPEPDTFVQKLLFYTTAFFILLATFSLFAFLFLVPFVIDPAFTTIFMQFEETPTQCTTVDVKRLRGATNCTWSSCREGCTRDIYDCTQIWVNYQKVGERPPPLRKKRSLLGIADVYENVFHRRERAIRDYDYVDNNINEEILITNDLSLESDDRLQSIKNMNQQPKNVSQVIRAKLFPNVKGCGYPPGLNCTIFTNKYRKIGSNFTCYFSWIDEEHVISEFDLKQVYMNLVYSMAIPIPSFFVSLIYLTFAYFVIYAEDPSPPRPSSVPPGTTPVPPPTSGALTPASEVFREDLASFGHDLKVAMADEASRESVATCVDSSNDETSSKTHITATVTETGPIASV